MKRIIVLKGVSETGKSTKIKEIVRWIVSAYEEHTTTINLDKPDMHGVIYIKNLSIGVCSAGDNLEEILKLEALRDENNDFPDIILCACRTRGITQKYIKQHFNRNNGWLLIFIRVLPFNDVVDQVVRDSHIIEEVKCRLIGLEKK